MSLGIILQARMGSTRLPGKVMKPILGRPMLFYQLERLSRVGSTDRLLVATTTLEEDQPIVNLCEQMGVSCYRGSEHDLLSRYLDAAHAFGIDTIIRSTGDCPLIDPALIEKGALLFQTSSVDYLSNTLHRTYPRGMDIEIFKTEALEKADLLCRDPSLREHVTPAFYQTTEFKIENFEDVKDHSSWRLTVDTQEDFNLIEHLLEELYPQNPCFSLDDIIKALHKHPDWVRINQHIPQKKIREERWI